MKFLTQNISKTLENFSLVTLVANYHRLSLLPDPDQKFDQTLTKIWKPKIGVKFWILLFLLQMSYIFISSTKDLNALEISIGN